MEEEAEKEGDGCGREQNERKEAVLTRSADNTKSSPIE